jgi:hypothetical protein
MNDINKISSESKKANSNSISIINLIQDIKKLSEENIFEEESEFQNENDSGSKTLSLKSS